MKVGFVNIFGKPNVGKSTLLNAMTGEKLAIVSPKVQTTRHRIKSILTGNDYQVVLSDTPGIIEPQYRLHEKMMQTVKNALEDADLALLLTEAKEDLGEADAVFNALRLKVPCIVVINKTDTVPEGKIETMKTFFSSRPYCKEVIAVSALKQTGITELLQLILKYLPEGEPFFSGEELSDLPTRFFAGEMIREKIYQLYSDEIPYHSTVLVKEFKEKETLTKISADIIVQRESQKGILLGAGGKMIRQLGTEARKDLEQFLGRKVFLELFVKVRPRWRDSDLFLKEYGYT